jgi:predicted enzyme related to lactoylglutathione lyase
MPPMTEGVPPHWNVYFNVESVDDTIARVEDLGGSVVAPAFDVPGTGRMAMLADPQGGMFNLMGS